MKYIAFSVVALAACATAAFSRAFVKIQIGPLYVLDLLFLLWLFFASWSLLGLNFRHLLSTLRAPLAFFFWGLAILLINLSSQPLHANSPLLPRILQHSLLFVYPLVWIAVGNWLWLADRRFPFWILMGIFLSSTLANLWYHEIVNLSIGPLMIIPSLFAFNESQDPVHAIRERLLYFIFSVLLTLITFTPFWVMSMTHLQRSSLLLLIFMIFVLAFYLRRTRPSPYFAPKAILFSFGLLIAGFFVMFEHQLHPHLAGTAPVISTSHLKLTSTPKGSSPGITVQTFTSSTSITVKARWDFLSHPFIRWTYLLLQHGEDTPIPGDTKPFQMRTRRFMWGRALSQWRKHRLIGIGFVEEVPDFVEPNYPNTGGFEREGSPPVSGPHNSYLSILARMGLVGLALFFLMTGQWLYQARLLMHRPLHWGDLVLILLPINGMIYALFNVGFESPHNCMLMWLAIGIILARKGTGPHENPVRS
jgi:hypothetical protein